MTIEQFKNSCECLPDEFKEIWVDTFFTKLSEMVLHHLNKIDVNDIIKVCKETNTQYKVNVYE